MIALITGASSGIGKALAFNLAERKFNLILVARRLNLLEDIKRQIMSKYHVKVKIIQKDLSSVEACKELYAETKGVSPEIVINNAGFGLFGGFCETDLDRELEMINVNIKAVHTLTKLFLKDFKSRDYGYILNVASVAGLMAGPYLSSYYATKNYVVSLTKGIYEELHCENSDVHISVLCPGPVKTEFNAVSGANFAISGLTDTEVADYAITSMFKDKLIIIPSAPIKMAALASRIVPTKLMLSCTRLVQEQRS